MVKPNEEIYKYILNKYELNAKECIFIDEKREDTQAAGRQGIIGYTFDGYVKKLNRYIENNIY